jgi:hypothetical protein
VFLEDLHVKSSLRQEPAGVETRRPCPYDRDIDHAPSPSKEAIRADNRITGGFPTWSEYIALGAKAEYVKVPPRPLCSVCGP